MTEREPTRAELVALTICVVAVCATVVAIAYLALQAVAG